MLVISNLRAVTPRSCFGVVGPTRARRLADASVDHTEARSVTGSGPDAWAVRRGGNRPDSVPSPPTRPTSHPGGPTAPSHRTRAFLVTWAIPTFAFTVAELLVVAGVPAA